MKVSLFLFSFVSVFVLAMPARSDVVVNRIFSDHMVLQQDLGVPVWGTAQAGEVVTVQFRDQSKSATATGDGKWILKLDPLKLGDPGEMIVIGKTSTTTFSDVLVGEVWLGSGQSNMAGNAGRYANNDPVLAKMIQGTYPTLRLYTGTGWKAATPDTIAPFSAIHFAFGHALHRDLGIPVGLMVGAVGGTPSGRWMSEAMVEADPAMMAQLKTVGGFESIAALKAGHAEAMEAYKAKLANFKAEQVKTKSAGKRAPRYPGPNLPGDLYARFIEPKAPYGIRGVLWDQGESRVQIPGVDQYTAMNALITGWRKVWGQNDFPFLHVQKPSGNGCAFDPENPINAGAKAFTQNLPGAATVKPGTLAYELDHIRIGTLKNAPLVTATDLGIGIHPACKTGYGERAARVALGFTYGKGVAISGPVYKSHAVEKGKIRVQFNHTGKGLTSRHSDQVRGFAIAGKDGPWVWADARIDGESILVSSSEVADPVQVQYAFSKDHSFANLFNKDGLPAQMFTTVEWR